MVDKQALDVFSRVSAWAGPAAARRIKKIIGQNLKRGMKVLDIGTGPGTIPLNLKKLYPEVHFIGMDISSGMIHTAQKHARKMDLALPLTVGDGESLPFGAGKIDCIISLFAMHHMDHPKKLLQEIDRVLKPGGRLLILDFHRDMAAWLFRLINTIWQIIFLFSAAKKGFADSAHSAWRQDEIQYMLEQSNIDRFKVQTNMMEMFIRDVAEITSTSRRSDLG